MQGSTGCKFVGRWLLLFRNENVSVQIVITLVPELLRLKSSFFHYTRLLLACASLVIAYSEMISEPNMKIGITLQVYEAVTYRHGSCCYQISDTKGDSKFVTNTRGESLDLMHPWV